MVIHANTLPSDTSEAASSKASSSQTLGQQLIDASCKGDLPKVSALIHAGAPVDFKDDNGNTPLHAACGCFEDSAVKLEVVRYLLAHGADVNAKVLNLPKCTPLHWACVAEDNIGVLKMLLQKKADVNALDHEGSTPLHWASWMPNINTVVVLLMYSADIRATNVKGNTPLHVACLADNVAIASLLLKNVEAEDAKQVLQTMELSPEKAVYPLVQHFAALADSGTHAAFQLHNETGRLQLNQRRLCHFLLWVVSGCPSEAPRWVHVRHGEAVTKLVIICLVGVPQVRANAFPMLAQLCSRACVVDLPAGPVGPNMFLHDIFFRKSPKIAVADSPPVPPPPAPSPAEEVVDDQPKAHCALDVEVIKTFCLTPSEAEDAGYPMWNKDCVGWYCTREQVTTAAHPVVVLSCKERYDAETAVGTQYTMMSLTRKVLFDIYIADDIAEAAADLELQHMVMRLISSDTILLGHSATLAMALRKLKLVHLRLVDVLVLHQKAKSFPSGLTVQMLAADLLPHWKPSDADRPVLSSVEDCTLTLELLQAFLTQQAPPPETKVNEPPAAIAPIQSPDRKERSVFSVRCITTDPNAPLPENCTSVCVSSDDEMCTEVTRELDHKLEEVIWLQLSQPATKPSAGDDVASNGAPTAKRQKVHHANPDELLAQQRMDQMLDKIITSSLPNTAFVIHTAPGTTLAEATQGMAFLFVQNQVVIPASLTGLKSDN